MKSIKYFFNALLCIYLCNACTPEEETLHKKDEEISVTETLPIDKAKLKVSNNFADYLVKVTVADAFLPAGAEDVFVVASDLQGNVLDYAEVTNGIEITLTAENYNQNTFLFSYIRHNNYNSNLNFVAEAFELEKGTEYLMPNFTNESVLGNEKFSITSTNANAYLNQSSYIVSTKGSWQWYGTQSDSQTQWHTKPSDNTRLLINKIENNNWHAGYSYLETTYNGLQAISIDLSNYTFLPYQLSSTVDLCSILNPNFSDARTILFGYSDKINEAFVLTHNHVNKTNLTLPIYRPAENLFDAYASISEALFPANSYVQEYFSYNSNAAYDYSIPDNNLSFNYNKEDKIIYYNISNSNSFAELTLYDSNADITWLFWLNPSTTTKEIKVPTLPIDITNIYNNYTINNLNMYLNWLPVVYANDNENVLHATSYMMNYNAAINGNVIATNNFKRIVYNLNNQP